MSNSSWETNDGWDSEGGTQFGVDTYSETSSISADPFANPTYADDEGFSSLKEKREKAGQASMSAMFGVDSSIASAVAGAQMQIGGAGRKEEFLSYNKRGVFERTTWATGVCYMSGILLGGSRGFVQGLANSPSPRFRVRVNSVLNGCGRGARLGNSLGILALYFTSLEAGFDMLEVDRHARIPGSDWLSPVLAAGVTGVLYRSTAGPAPAALSGVIGALGAGLFIVGGPWAVQTFPQISDMVPGLR